MQLAMIGLGRMGGNMVQRLLKGGHELVVFDRSTDVVQQHVGDGRHGREGPGRRVPPASRRLAWPG